MDVLDLKSLDDFANALNGLANALGTLTGDSTGTNSNIRFGVAFVSVNPEIAQSLSFPISQYNGIYVQSVAPGSAAEKAVAPGDIITHINDQPVPRETGDQLNFLKSL